MREAGLATDILQELDLPAASCRRSFAPGTVLASSCRRCATGRAEGSRSGDRHRNPHTASAIAATPGLDERAPTSARHLEPGSASRPVSQYSGQARVLELHYEGGWANNPGSSVTSPGYGLLQESIAVGARRAQISLERAYSGRGGSSLRSVCRSPMHRFPQSPDMQAAIRAYAGRTRQPNRRRWARNGSLLA